MPAFQEELVVKLRGPGGVAASGAPQVERFSGGRVRPDEEMVAGTGHGWQSGVVVLDRLTRISLRVGLRVLGGLAALAGLALVCQYQTGYPLRRTLHLLRTTAGTLAVAG